MKIKLENIFEIRKDLTKEEKRKIKSAYLFAEKSHQGQKFDGTKYSYFLHPAYSGFLMAKWKQSADAICGAILHDIVEDCEVSLETIRRLFGHNVAFYVDGMSWERKWNSKKKMYLKDWNGFFKKICDYSVQDPTIVLLHCADEKSKLEDITSKKFSKTDEKLEKTKKRYLMYLSFYVPFYREVGLKSHAKRQFEKFYSITKKNSKSKLNRYISDKELKLIKNKLTKINGIGELK